MKWNFQKILVTGSSGFIGSHLVEEFAALGISVIGIDRMPSTFETAIDGFEEHIGDIGDEYLIRELVSKVDLVLHIAAKPSVPDSWETPGISLNENIVKTSIVVDACNKASVPVYIASSSSIYGIEGTAINPYRPISPYGVSKAAMEMLINAYQTQRSLNGGILRFFNVFGPRHRINVSNPPVIAKIMECLRKDEPFLLQGSGEQSRDFTYVKDLTKAVRNIVINNRNSLKPIEVSFNRTISLNGLIQTIEEVAGRRLSTISSPERIGDIRTSAADGSIDNFLTEKVEPTPLKQALTETWAWHKRLRG